VGNVFIDKVAGLAGLPQILFLIGQILVEPVAFEVRDPPFIVGFDNFAIANLRSFDIAGGHDLLTIHIYGYREVRIDQSR
jgi:hypothetical protein